VCFTGPFPHLSGAFHPLLLRALSLFGPGELRAVCVIDPTCFELIVSELDRPDSVGAVRLAQALSSVRAVAWPGSDTSMAPAVDFIKRHGGSLIELDCDYWHHRDEADRALACCARLESLTNARYYDAKVWLGLTHLHTLRGVDFGDVSAAAVAAALPRLHTLAAFINASYDPPFPIRRWRGCSKTSCRASGSLSTVGCGLQRRTRRLR
jgi:hypothetical protein